METGQTSLPEVLEILDKEKRGKVTINAFITNIKRYFPQLSKEDITKLFQTFDIDKNSLIDIDEVNQVLGAYSSQQLTFKQLVYKLALVVMEAKVPTSQFFTNANIDPESQMQ